jgi:hypothetical protein
MLKKFLKVTGIVVAVTVAFVITGLVYLFIKLPSVNVIGDAFRNRSNKPLVAEEKLQSSESNPRVENSSADFSQAVNLEKKAVDSSDAQTLSYSFLEDIISTQKPMSDFCASLKNAKFGQFNQKEFDVAFNRSLSIETQDPRVQAVKPILRYMMRLPKMTEMIGEAEAAVERKDESFLKKAEFYSKALSAFSEMKTHRGDIESVMDRSYLLLGLNNLVAHKPDMINDSRLQNYCTNIEISFNQVSPVDYDQEKNDFLDFLSDLNVKPEEIGFNQNYKSTINFHFSGQTMTFEGGWLSDLVKSDVELETDLKSTTN